MKVRCNNCGYTATMEPDDEHTPGVSIGGIGKISVTCPTPGCGGKAIYLPTREE